MSFQRSVKTFDPVLSKAVQGSATKQSAGLRAKQHRLINPQPWKVSGYNQSKPQRHPSKVKPKDQVKYWNIFKNDTVMVMAGASKGNTGKVIQVDRPNNLVYVQGQRLVTKFIPVTPLVETHGLIKLEAGIHYSNVALIDPNTNTPTKVRWELISDPLTGKMIRRRISRKSGLEIPRPAIDPTEEDKDKIKDTPLDTLQADVVEQTYTPSLQLFPFPEGFSLSRHRRW